MSHHRRAVGALVVAVAALAACSVSTSPPDQASGSSASAPSGDDVPRDTRAVDAPTRGVSDDTLKIGVATIDFNRIRDEFGVDLGGLPDEVVPALVAATNADGGINGRQVELTENPIMPIGAEDSERACRELIEDDESFAVLGLMLGEAPLCVTENYETPYIGLWGLTDQIMERSVAPFVSLVGTETLAVNTQAVLDTGVLDGHSVAVYYEGSDDPERVQEQTIDLLEADGIEVVSEAQLPSSGDATQAATDIDRILQRFQADGADALVLPGTGAGVIIPALGRTTWSPQLVFLDNGQFVGVEALGNFGLTDPAELDGAVLQVANLVTEDLLDDPLLADCMDRINAHSDLDLVPEDIIPASELPGSPGLWPVSQACQLWDLAVTVLEAAGDEPTAQSLLDGLADVGDFAITGYPDAHLAPDQWGAVTATRAWHFDTDSGAFVPDGPIEAVEG